MALTNIFRINFPYGVAINEKDELLFLNREYMQLGCYDRKFKKGNEDDYYQNLARKYNKLNFEKVRQIVFKHTGTTKFAQAGVWRYVMFYDDPTNPSEKGNKFNSYLKLIEEFSKFDITYPEPVVYR